jgi:uncharacterized protein (DUF1800 family)
MENKRVQGSGGYARKLLLTLLTSALVACGGGGSDSPATGAANPGTGNTDPGTPTAVYNDASLSPKAEFSEADIRHFLSRTHFGIQPGTPALVQSKGLSVYIDEMMAFAPTGSQPFEADAAALLQNDDDPAGLEGKFPGVSDVVDWNIHLLMNNPNAFQEVMGMFWQDHFGVDFETFRGEEDHLMIDFINLLRERGVGNFRDLLVDISRHGAMLIFLDGADNSKFAPNENYAREFWELYTLGVDNGYSEDDVIEASRAFTGWRRQYNPGTGLTQVIFDPESKAVGSKQPLGNSVSHNLSTDDYAVMVDLTMQHADDTGHDRVSLFLSRKLLRHFHSENPSDALVSAFATELRQNNLNIGPALKTLFLSESFYSAAATEGLIRDFYEQVVGLVRTTGLKESNWQYRRYLTEMESLPSRPPSVEGWPEGDDKINSHATGVAMPNFVNELITNRGNQEDEGYDIGAAMQPAGATTAAEVVDHVAMLLGVTLDSTERQDLIDYMNVEISSDGTETPVNYTPQNTNHQSRKLRNLLWILCQHPSFHLK